MALGVQVSSRRHVEGSTVFLPFKADLLLSAEIRGGQINSFLRRWERWRWSEREQTQAFAVSELNDEFIFRIPRAMIGDGSALDFVIYAKDPSANDGWGWFWGRARIRRSKAAPEINTFRHYHEKLRLQSLFPERGPGRKWQPAEWAKPDFLSGDETLTRPTRDTSTPLRFARNDSGESAETSASILTRRDRHGAGQ